MDLITTYPSPLGLMVIASDGAGIVGAWFQGQKYFGAGLGEAQDGEDALLGQGRAWLTAYFQGEMPPPFPRLAPRGTPFQREVWGLLAEIPYGETMTYGAIAAVLAERRGLAAFSPRAVGGSVGRNPLSLFIPCHRVVGAKGRLTGYAGGLERKKALLALERSFEPGTKSCCFLRP